MRGNLAAEGNPAGFLALRGFCRQLANDRGRHGMAPSGLGKLSLQLRDEALGAVENFAPTRSFNGQRGLLTGLGAPPVPWSSAKRLRQATAVLRAVLGRCRAPGASVPSASGFSRGVPRLSFLQISGSKSPPYSTYAPKRGPKHPLRRKSNSPEPEKKKGLSRKKFRGGVRESPHKGHGWPWA